jgi:5'-nucleotidase
MRTFSRNFDHAPSAHGRNGVYVNYTLDFTRVAAVGLDLDHTLAVYHDQTVNQLAFAETCRHLIELKGYPPSLSGLTYDNSTISRGVVADALRGNLLKLDCKDTVRRAYHGKNQIAAKVVTELYGNRPIAAGGAHYPEILTPFDLPAGRLYALALESLGVEACRTPPDYRTILGDIIETLDHTHTHGDLKRQIVSDPARYIEKRPVLTDTIVRFRREGKRVFMVTNSGYAYTAAVLDYLFSDHAGGWRALFDLVVVDACKPAFFGEPERGFSLPDAPVDPSGPSLGVLCGGGAPGLEGRLGASGEEILFVGDNPAADCAAARPRGWRTALVVPELTSDPFAPDVVPETRSGEDDGWGSIFWEAGSPTRFTRALCECADVFGASVERILEGGPYTVFRGR